MPYTHKQIMLLQNPYQCLNNAELLAENIDELEKSTLKEMKELAIKMLTFCPTEEMKDFGLAINALNKPGYIFYVIINQVYEIKTIILDFLDSNNETPFLTTISAKFNSNLFKFKEYNAFVLYLLKNQEVRMATKLSLTTPEKMHSKVAINLNYTFPNSLFATKVNAAFSLYREINRFLLGDKPQEFFLNKEFNPELCHEFSDLFLFLLKGHEHEVGAKLSVLDHTIIHNISRKLEILNNKAKNKNNSFKLISASLYMHLQEESKESEIQTGKIDYPTTKNLYHYFNSSVKENKLAIAEPNKIHFNDKTTCLECNLI